MFRLPSRKESRTLSLEEGGQNASSPGAFLGNVDVADDVCLSRESDYKPGGQESE
jgi:hypothetical protein